MEDAHLGRAKRKRVPAGAAVTRFVFSWVIGDDRFAAGRSLKSFR